ncbi:MAG: NOL1/NOP2/sun family putative RNA methylase [Candidatus Nanoarchaeia archaeon]
MNTFLKRYSDWGFDENPKNIDIRPALRINTLKIERDALFNRLKEKNVSLKKIHFLKNGYWYASKFSLGAAPEYLQGHYYIQEAASQIPPMILDPKHTDLVLDCCAAPGSKTTGLAQIMGNKGCIVALDRDRRRIAALNNNIERMGVKNTIVYDLDSRDASALGLKFDKILVDAPCSGNFSMDRNWFPKRDINGIRRNAKKQKPILSEAIKLLKKNGVLVYSTCSLEIEEDEKVIAYALDNFNVKLESTNLKIGVPGLTDRTKLCRRLWPGRDGTQGFFVAKLRKK